MRTFLFTILLALASGAMAQNDIFALVVGNWRNGPVLLSPVLESNEAETDVMLVEPLRKEHASMREARDVDVLRFSTYEMAEEHRQSLIAKYGRRGITVVELHSATDERNGSDH